jgi:hypothetical protein
MSSIFKRSLLPLERFTDEQYLWLQYAAFEEIDTKDFERAREVYKAAIKLVPHKTFTFAKVSPLFMIELARG